MFLFQLPVSFSEYSDST